MTALLALHSLRRSISTHTPLAGRDCDRAGTHTGAFAFQLTRPLRGVTSLSPQTLTARLVFQLTRPLRGVTEAVIQGCKCGKFQLTRPLRGVTCFRLEVA